MKLKFLRKSKPRPIHQINELLGGGNGRCTRISAPLSRKRCSRRDERAIKIHEGGRLPLCMGGTTCSKEERTMSGRIKSQEGDSLFH